MSAGSPNWLRLAEMGKLPPGAIDKVPMLAQAKAAESKLEQLKKDMCDDCRARLFPEKEEVKEEVKEEDIKLVEVKCEQCDYVGKGKSEAGAKNMIRLHSKTHVVKTEE